MSNSEPTPNLVSFLNKLQHSFDKLQLQTCCLWIDNKGWIWLWGWKKDRQPRVIRLFNLFRVVFRHLHTRKYSHIKWRIWDINNHCTLSVFLCSKPSTRREDESCQSFTTRFTSVQSCNLQGRVKLPQTSNSDITTAFWISNTPQK